MRPIKFRAWDGQKMHYFPMNNVGDVLPVLFDGTGYRLLLINGGESHAELMQYTGLKDRKCKEIYEGDVLRITDHKFPENNELVYRKVVYIGLPPLCGFGLADFSTPTYNEPLGRIMKDIDDEWQVEVIGNIYKNPELLK